MTREEIHKLLEDLVEKYEGDFNPPVEREDAIYDPPRESDWAFLREKVGGSFSPEFVDFMELITGYNCPGVLNVRRESRTNGDPTVDWWYDREMTFGRWDADLLPFFAIGDGTFYCLRISAGESSPVYFVDETGAEEEHAASFEDWLRRLEYFLHG